MGCYLAVLATRVPAVGASAIHVDAAPRKGESRRRQPSAITGIYSFRKQTEGSATPCAREASAEALGDSA